MKKTIIGIILLIIFGLGLYFYPETTFVALIGVGIYLFYCFIIFPTWWFLKRIIKDGKKVTKRRSL